MCHNVPMYRMTKMCHLKSQGLITLLFHILHIGSLNDRCLTWASLETSASVPIDSYIKVSLVKVVVCLSKSNKHRKKEIRKTSFFIGWND